MRKPFLPFVFLFAWLSSFCQDFPMPMYYYTWFTDNYDSVVLKWNTPPNQNPSHYNLYYFGDNDGLPLPIGTTVDTTITFPTPDFAWKMNYGLTAVYSDPYGESDTNWVQFIAGSGFWPPFIIDFEDAAAYQPWLVESVKAGSFCWRINNEEYFSPVQSAAFIADSANYISSLRTTYISIKPEETLKLSFMYKIPVLEGQTDTLKLSYFLSGSGGSWIPFGETYHSTDEWQPASYTFDPGTGRRIAFTATAGGGTGVFIDDMVFEEISTGIAENKNLQNELRISPNPVKDVLTLEFNLYANTLAVLQVFTKCGKLVKSMAEFHLQSGRHHRSIDVSGLQSGVYFIRLNLNGKQFTKKMLKY